MKAVIHRYLHPRYVLLYAQAVIFPVLLLLITLSYTNGLVTRNLYTSNAAALTQTQESMDSSFSELEKILTYMGQHDSLTRYNMENHPADVVAILKEIADTHPLIYDVIITTRDSDYYHTSLGSQSVNDLGAQHFVQDFLNAGLTTSDWLSMMNTVTEPVYWSCLSQQKSSYSSYLYLIAPVCQPLQTDGSVAIRTATLVVPQSHIHNVFYSSQTSLDEGLLLLAPDGTLLTKLTSQRTDAFVPDICRYINEFPDMLSEDYMQLPGSDIVMFASRSSKTGLISVRFLSESDAYLPYRNLQSISTTITLFAVAAGLAVVYLYIRQNTMPVHSLAEWIRRNQHDGREINNALVVFRNALDTSKTLAHTADRSRQQLTDHLLADLLSGNYSSERAFHQDCLALGIPFHKSYYAVSTIIIEEDGGASVSYERVSEAIRSCLPEIYQAQLKDMLHAGKLILLINSDSNDDSIYKTAMMDLKNYLMEQQNLMVSIGMGSFYDSYEKVRKSYFESICALDYRLIYGRNCLITPDIVSSRSSALTISYPSHDLDLLETALASGSTSTAESILQRIHTAIKLNNYSLRISKCICYDITSSLKKHEKSLPHGHDEDFPFFQIIADLTDQNSINTFFESAAKLLHFVPAPPAEPTVTTASGAGSQLVEYAEAHCLSYDFQIKNMAEHFSISPQYMRKLFKIQTGMSISEYVSSKRLEKSMYLLTQTDMSLQDIVAEIGNSDISGFVRFFKQKTGLTPGQYRKAHKQQN